MGEVHYYLVCSIPPHLFTPPRTSPLHTPPRNPTSLLRTSKPSTSLQIDGEELMELQRSPSTVVRETEASLLEMEVVVLDVEARSTSNNDAAHPLPPLQPSFTSTLDTHCDQATDLFTYRRGIYKCICKF